MSKYDLRQFLPMQSNELGILIKWNAISGKFEVFTEGARVSIEQIALLFKEAYRAMGKNTDEDGMIGRPKEEKEPASKNLWEN